MSSTEYLCSCANYFKNSLSLNGFPDMILDCLHEKFKVPDSILDRNYRVFSWSQCDILGSLNFDGCCLIVETFSASDSKNIYRSLNLLYPQNDSACSVPLTETGIFDVITDTQGSIENTISSKDMQNSANQFAANLRMIFGSEGFHYLCSLSHDENLHAFSGDRRSERLLDDTAFRMVTQESDNIFMVKKVSNSKPFLAAMADTIHNKKLHDLAEMYVKL